MEGRASNDLLEDQHLGIESKLIRILEVPKLSASSFARIRC
jgi:hypothetical protein